MRRSIHFPKSLLLIGVPLLILSTLFIISKTTLFEKGSDHLVVAITIDLLLTLPLSYYLIVRKTKVPNITVAPVLILGILIGSWILPKEDQTYLNLFKTWGLPLIELFVISFVIYKVRKAIQQFRTKQIPGADFYSTLIETCQDLFPRRLVYPLATEIAVFYYGFVRWKRSPLSNNEFTYHRDSGTIALMIAILFMISVETFVIHLLLDQWSAIAAWILSLLSIYSGLQIFGFMKSMFFRPIVIQDGVIFLRYGIMSETKIKITDIEKVELNTTDLDEGVAQLSLLGNLESHNMIVHLNTENEIFRLYGIKKSYQKLAMHVDEPEKFMAAISGN